MSGLRHVNLLSNEYMMTYDDALRRSLFRMQNAEAAVRCEGFFHSNSNKPPINQYTAQ